MHAFGRLNAIIQAELGSAAHLTPESAASEVAGWDSGAMVNILFAVEDAFGVTFSSAEMEEVRGVPDILAVLQTRGLSDWTPSRASRRTLDLGA